MKEMVRKQLRGLRTRTNELLGHLGFSISRLGVDDASFANFRNLCAGYERLFSRLDGQPEIPANEQRLQILSRLLGTPPTEAYYLVGALCRVSKLEGDVCEFGVAQGETSALIANEIRATDKHLHLFDSFQGLSAPTHMDRLKDDVHNLGSMSSYKGEMSYPQRFVIRRLLAIGFPEDRYSLHPGFIEEVLASDPGCPREVSFAYVDFDLYEPILTALRYLDTVLVGGGVVIVDDYDFFSTGAKSAVDEFVADANTSSERYALEVPDEDFGHFAVLTRRGDSSPPSQ